MPSLDGALAITQVHHVAVSVAEHLDFDVSRLIEVPLQVHRVITEGCERFTLSGLEGPLYVGLGLDHAHAFSAATRGSLEQHRESQLNSGGGCLFGARDRLRQAWHDGDAGLRHSPPRLGLVSHRRYGLGRGPHEDQTGVLDCLRERCLLREEAVSGVDRFRARGLGYLDQLVSSQVTLSRSRRSDRVRLVRLQHVRREPIRLGKDGDASHPPLAGRANDAYCDLAAVGDEQGSDHSSGLLKCRRFNGTMTWGSCGPKVSPRMDTKKGQERPTSRQVLPPHRAGETRPWES